MHNRISVFLLVSVILGGISCEPVEPILPNSFANNSQSNVDIETVKFNIRHLTTSEEWLYFTGDYVDITNYRNVDSIRFAANMRSQMFTEKCIVELYDFTNERAVLNSTVDSNVRFYFKYVESSDLLKYFPQEEVLMGIRLRSSKEGNPVEVAYDSEIILYSH